MIATTSISNVSNSIIVISAHLVSEGRLNRLPLCSIRGSLTQILCRTALFYIIARLPIFVNFSEHIFEHILKHFCKVLGLFILRKLLFCSEAAPLVADSVFVLSEVLQILHAFWQSALQHSCFHVSVIRSYLRTSLPLFFLL